MGKTHQMSLGQWQGSESGAGRVLQSCCHCAPHIYRSQQESFWHYLFGGLKGKRGRQRKGEAIAFSLLKSPSPNGRLPALAAALNPRSPSA